MGFIDWVGQLFSGTPEVKKEEVTNPFERHPDNEVLVSSHTNYGSTEQNFFRGADEIGKAGTYIEGVAVDYANWCKDNPFDCALATLDYVPLAGTAARCGQYAVQSLDGDLGEDTQFNCEMNAVGDLIPIVGKEVAVGAKAAFRGAAKAARGTKAASTLRLAKTKFAQEGLSKAEKEAAQMELGRASGAYAKTVARETERIEAEIADEALEMEANNAARLAAREESEFIAFAEKRAAEMEERAAIKAARDAEVGGMIKEAQAASKLQAKVRAKAAARLAEKAEADAADHAAMRRGAKQNAAKDAKPKPKTRYEQAKARLKALTKRTIASDLAEIPAEAILSFWHCEEDFLNGDDPDFVFHHDGPALYTHNPLCPEEKPKPKPKPKPTNQPDYEYPDPIQIPPPWEYNPPLDPDLWLSLRRPTTATEAGYRYDPSSIYLAGCVLVLVAAGAYAYYKF